MAPANTFKIQLEAIEKSGASKETRDLATTIAKLTQKSEKLQQAIEKSIEITRKTGDINIDVVRRNERRLKLLEESLVSLEKVVGKAAKVIEKAPDAIGKAVKLGQTVAKAGAQFKKGDIVGGVRTAIEGKKELLQAVNLLRSIDKRIKGSDTFAVGRQNVLNKLTKALEELKKEVKKPADIAKSVKELVKATGAPVPARRQITERTAPSRLPGVEKVLKDVSSDFKKVVDKLGEKQVVVVDLETSEFKKQMTEAGKRMAVEFISQIAVKKGTLKDILAGKGKGEEILIKPPGGIKTQEDLEKLLGTASKVNKITLDRLNKEGVEATAAMKRLAEILKDAEAIIGQNIKGFDIFILEDAFKKAGVTLETGIKSVVDTMELGFANFPERSSQKLEDFLKDLKVTGQDLSDLGKNFRNIAVDASTVGTEFKDAAKNIKDVSDGMHDAKFDVDLTVKFLQALNKNTDELSAAEGNLVSSIQAIERSVVQNTVDFDRAKEKVKRFAEEIKKTTDSTTKLASESDFAADDISDYRDSLGKAAKATGRATIEIEKLSTVRSSLQAATFKKQIITPQTTGAAAAIGGIGPSGVPGATDVAETVGNIAKSLDKLQSNIVASLEKGLSRTMQIIRDESGKAFQLAPGGREFEIKIADIGALRKTLIKDLDQVVDPTASAKAITEQFTRAFAQRQLRSPRSLEAMAESVISELGSASRDVVSEFGPKVTKLFEEIRQQSVSVADVAAREDLPELFREVALKTQAERKLNEEFIKRLAIPAAALTPQGTLSFETKKGAQRSLSQFATITTGLEKLVTELGSLGASAIETERLSRQVSEVGLRPSPGGPEEAKAEKLAKTLIDRIIQLGGRQLVGRGLQRSIALREVETGERKPGATEISATSEQSLVELINKADQLGIKSIEVAKALDEISFENVFDILDKLFQAGKTPFLENQAANIGKFDKNLRAISKVITDTLGLLPLTEEGRPRGAAKDIEAFRVFTKPTAELRPEEQKKHIIDTNLLVRDISKAAELLGETKVPILSSLDLSDAASTQLRQFNTEFSSSLKELNKTMIALSAAGIRETSPFPEFAQQKRQVSFTRAGLAGGLPGGGGFETPSLVGARERAQIESGRVGTGGFGLNVLTELRNTASTFEDQIIISGKLADAFTRVVRRLVKPAVSLAEGTTEIQPGVQRITPRGARLLSEEREQDFERTLKDVAKEFQQILGVSQKFEGRSDIAEIGEEVKQIVREQRGQTVELQAAKITETFLNFFGRKLATRFGTKGVSVTVPKAAELPGGISGTEDVAKFIQAGFKSKVAVGGLGFRQEQKSVGQLLSDLLEDEGPELHNRLIESGNKFILDLFKPTDIRIVTEEEAKKQVKLFQDATEAYKKAFVTEFPSGVAGIREIKELFVERFGEEKLTTFRPIEARISSKGIAKRGLQGDVLEGIVNNLIGSVEGTTTLLDKFGDKAQKGLFETSEGVERVNNILEALGFKAFDDLGSIGERLKLESPKITDEIIEGVKAQEAQWKVYSTVVDEFGETIQSFVAPKFLQIVKEPAFFPGRTERELGKGLEGTKFDFQSFAALATVFGEGSAALKELASQTSATSAEGFELIRAFQLLDPSMKALRESTLQGLRTVKLGDIKAFDDATSTVEGFRDTIFDLSKFPDPFKVEIPTGRGGVEQLAVPGAALRGTFQEELIGERAPTNVARSLSSVISAAKKVTELVEATKGGDLSQEFQDKFANTLRGELTKSLTGAIKQFQKIERGTATPQNIEFMQKTLAQFAQGLSATRPAEPIFQEGQLDPSELASAKTFGSKTKGAGRFSTILGRISDLLVGVNPESIKRENVELEAALKKLQESGQVPGRFKGRSPEKVKGILEGFIERNKEKLAATAIFDIELEAGNLDQFAKSVGLSLQESIEEALIIRKGSLTKAKVAFSKVLGEEVLGRKKAIEQVFFQRITPSATGTAVAAQVDKTRELTKLLEALTGTEFDIDLNIQTKDGKTLGDLGNDLERLTEKHKEFVDKARILGLPVLKEGEIGLSVSEARKVKLRTGEKGDVETNLAELIKTQEKVFVESVRFPFTGEATVQPFIAKLLGGELSKRSIAVPGAPQLDAAKLNEIIGTLREFVGVAPAGGGERTFLPEDTLSLLQQREKAWAEGTEMGAQKAMEFTIAIEGLLRVITDATPKFRSHMQKLDFDGDEIFVHTGQVRESREDIKKHFESLGKDVTSVRELFRSMFTAIKESDVQTLSEMGQVFGKRFPKEEGFEFLTQPTLRKDIGNLSINKVIESLFTFTPGASQLEAGTAKWQEAVAEWAKGFVANQILPEVFKKLGVKGTAQTQFLEKAQLTRTGLPETSATAGKLENNISRLADSLIRTQLIERRTADAISGQLFKLHTGQTVEGISRVARVSELETGFGRGIAGTGRGGAQPSSGFLSKFPEKSIALGADPLSGASGKPVQEFATRVNEIMRFVIQKGMDVKHAGVRAVGQDIIANIGKSSGAATIIKAMNEAKDQYDELADFNDQIENEVRLRLGKFSTEDLRQELKRFEPDIDIASIANIDRETLMKQIVKHVDLEATFEELFRQIRRQAIKGLSKQLQQDILDLPEGATKVKKLADIRQAGGIERFAAEQIGREAKSDVGISLFSRITTSLQPLFRLRTSMETLASAAKRSKVKPETGGLFLPAGEAGERLKKDMETAQRAANTITKSLMESVRGAGGGGIQDILVVSALKKRFKDLEELEKIDKESQKFAGGLKFPLVKIAEENKLATKLFTEALMETGLSAGGGLGPVTANIENISDFIGKLSEVREIVRKQVEGLSEKAGLPAISSEEKALIGGEAVGKLGKDVFPGIKQALEKEALSKKEQIVPEDLEQRAQEANERILSFVEFQASMVEQLRRVSEVIKTLPIQREFLKQTFPDLERSALESIRSQDEAVAQQQDRSEALLKFFDDQKISGQQGIKTFTIPERTAAAEDLQKEPVKAADEITQAINEAILIRKRNALKFLEAQAAGDAPGKEVPLHEVFRGSALKGGGTFGGGSQLEAVLGEMLGAPKGNEFLLETTGLRGTAVHRTRQREFLSKFPKAEIEKPVEDFENQITGHIDIIFEEAGKKIVTDVKTVFSQRQFDRLSELSEEIKKRNITIQQKLEELKSNEITAKTNKDVIRRLEDYISQVNFYLKNVEGAVGEILVVSSLDPNKEFTISIGEFDPALFDKDIAVVNEARSKVSEILKSLSETGGLPPDLLKDFPKIYEFITKRLQELSPEEFIKTLPTRPIGEVQASSEQVLNRLSTEQDRLFDELSREHLQSFIEAGGPGAGERPFKRIFAPIGAAGGGAAGAPPPPTPPGGTGGGFDDDGEELKRKVEAIISQMKRGIDPDVSEVDTLIRALKEALVRAGDARTRGDDELAVMMEQLGETIQTTIEQFGKGGIESFRSISKIFGQLQDVKRGRADLGEFEKARLPDIELVEPERPEAVFKNLKALFEAALRINKLADSEEIEKFGPEIVSLLGEAAEKGPTQEITTQIADAVSKLPSDKKGGMRRIWQFYKKAVAEHFINRLNSLSEDIKSEQGTSEGRRAVIEFDQVLEKFLANIRGTLGRSSDIFTTAGASGKKTQFVDPELAKLVGIFKSPKQIEAIVQQTTPLAGEFKSIFETLVGDLRPEALDDIATPLEKIRLAFKMLTDEDPNLKTILSDADLFRRIGDEAIKAWDFEKLVSGITQVRAGLEAYQRLQIGGVGGLGEEFTEDIRKNVTDTLGFLKQLEKAFSATGANASPLGIVPIPGFLDPGTQKLIGRRNVIKVRESFAAPEAEGGVPTGRSFNLRQKIIDPASKQVLSSTIVEFRKIGTTTNAAGKEVGLFTEKTKDLIKSLQESKGIGEAFGRALRFGVASRTIFGLVNALQSMVSTIAEVETGIAVLRQVMNPLTSDFKRLTATALEFAKDFGLPIAEVIDAMRVFAQQGLSQEEVVDRTRTSLLAANVTTLQAADATEAITAAMKVFGSQGLSTIRFIDSWSEVSAKHAVTSETLADALKKSAAVAQTAGLTFDELNGIITGIGETSRQTGKEIGTSLRFIFRRLTADKAPKELQKLGIPVIAEGGELRSSFDILGALADQWKELNNAQQLNIATAIGGRRHYNSLIILMNHWDAVLSSLGDSLNSKGAAERRNFIVMNTYAKKLGQVRASLSDLQVQFGQFALPVAKGLIDSFRFLLDTIANIPPGLKIAALAISGVFVAIAKGSSLLDSIINRVQAFSGVFGDLVSQFSKQFKIGIFEVFGKLPKILGSINTRGLSTITEIGKGIQDFESVLGKAGFVIAQFGRSWNSVMSEIAAGTASTSEIVGKAFGKVSSGLGAAATAVTGGFPVIGTVIETAAQGSKVPEAGFKKLGGLLGVPAEALARWSQENASFVKSVGPLVGSIAALIPIAGFAGNKLRKLALSADQYEQSLSPLRRSQTGQLADINNLSRGYEKLEKDIRRATESQKPEAVETAVRKERFKSPILSLAEASKEATTLANNIAKSNITLVESFDEFGNAILKPTDNLKEYFEVLRKAKIKEIAETEVDALAKFATELTNAGTSASRFRSELRRFVKEVPAIGPLLAKQIKVSPAQELKEARDEINRILAAREEFPLSTAFDTLFTDALKNLEEVKTRWKAFVGDFKRVLKNLDTTGLSDSQIKGLLDTEELKAGFELLSKIEPRLKKLNQTGQLDWEDILGIEILKRIQKKPLSIDYSANLTKAMLRESKIIQRSGKAFAGDIVLFIDEVSKEFNIAGNQGILKFSDDLGFFVEAIDKEMRTVKEIPFDSISQFVDSVFPVQRIIDQTTENLSILEEALTGAAAGMVGITDEKFKRTFSLGSRFFEQIPTTTLLQTQQGFDVGTRQFGPLEQKSELPNLVKKFFIEPQAELARRVEEPAKRIAAGQLPEKGILKDIERLGTIIRNNQVVIQYNALLVDLNKSFAESTKALSENIAAERVRNEILVETAGLLAGLPESFSDINLGIRDFFELSSQQRTLVRERGLPPEQRRFTQLRGQVTEATTRRESAAGELERIARARVQLETLRAQSRGTGVIVPPENLMRITESVAAGATVQEGIDLAVQKDISTHTFDTVQRLDDLLVATKDPKALERVEKRNIKSVELMGQKLKESIQGFGGASFRGTLLGATLPIPSFGNVSAELIKSQFDKLIRLRKFHSKQGNSEVVKSIDTALTRSSRELIDKVGFQQAANVVDPRFTNLISEAGKQAVNALGPLFPEPLSTRGLPSGQFGATDLIGRALPGEGLKQFVQRLEEVAGAPKELPETLTGAAGGLLVSTLKGIKSLLLTGTFGSTELTGSSELKTLKDAINNQTKISVVGSKTLVKLFAGIGAFSDIQRKAARREQRGFEVEERLIRQQQAAVLERRRSGEIPEKDFQDQIKGFAQQIGEVRKKRAEAASTAEKRATQEAVALIASASTAFARSVGASEKAIQFFGTSAAATIIGWNALTSLTGEEMPEAVKRGTEALGKMAKKIGEDSVGIFDKAAFAVGKTFGVGLGAAGEAGVAASDIEDLNKTQKDIFNEQEKQKILRLKELSITEEQTKKSDEALKNIKGGDAEKLAEANKLENINNDQLTTLIAIEENTRRGAESSEKGSEGIKDNSVKQPVESMTKTLRNKLDELKQARLTTTGGDTLTKLKDVLAAALITTVAGFVGEKTRTSAEIGEARRRAERVQAAFVDVVRTFPKEVDAIFAQLKIRREEARKDSGAVTTPEERQSLLLDEFKAHDDAIKQLDKFSVGLKKEAQEFGRIVGLSKERMGLIQVAQGIADDISQFAKTITESAIDLDIELKNRTQLTGALKGQPRVEELQFGKLESELTPTERLFKNGGDQLRDLFAAFKNIQNIRDGIIDLMKNNAKQIVASQLNFSAETAGIRNTIEGIRKKSEKAAERLKDFAPRKAVGGGPIFPEGGGPIFGPGEGPIFKGAGPISLFSEKEKSDIREKAKRAIGEFDQILDPSILIKEIESKKAKLKKFGVISKSIVENFREVTKGFALSELQELSKRREQIPGKAAAAVTARETFDIAAPKVNKAIITLKQEIADLEAQSERLKGSGLGKAISRMGERAKIAAVEAQLLALTQQKLQVDMSKVNEVLEILGQSFNEVGLSISTAEQDVRRLVASFKEAKIGKEFQRIVDDVLDKLRGGAAPEAPQFPTFELIQAGVPEDMLFEMTRAQQRIAEIIARTGRGPTRGERQRIQFEEVQLPKVRKAQGREDEELREQLRLAADLNTSIARLQQRAINIEDKDTKNEVKKIFQTFRDNLKAAVEGSTEIVGTKIDVEGNRVNLRRGANLEPIIKAFLDAMKALGEEIPEKAKAALKAAGIPDPDKLIEQLKIAGEVPEVVTELQKANTTLGNISTDMSSLLEAVKESNRGILEKFFNKDKKPAETKQLGGTIRGPGGPREDRVPILASPGEFMIKASSAGKLGRNALEFMNQTGEVPGFTGGGVLKRSFLGMGGRIKGFQDGGPFLGGEAFIEQQKALGVSGENIKTLMGGVEKDPILDPTGLIAGGFGAFALSGPLSSVIKSLLSFSASRIGKLAISRSILAVARESGARGVEALLRSVAERKDRNKPEQGKTPTIVAGPRAASGGLVQSFVPELFGPRFDKPEEELKLFGPKRFPQEMEKELKLFGPKRFDSIRHKIDPETGLFGIEQMFQEGGAIALPLTIAAADAVRYFTSTVENPTPPEFSSKGYKFLIQDLKARGYVNLANILEKRFGTSGSGTTYKQVFNAGQAILDQMFDSGTLTGDRADAAYNFTQPTGLLFKRIQFQDLEDSSKAMGGSIKRMPSFQFGGVMPETGPAFLHRGETILPADQNVASIDPGKILQGLESAAEKMGDVIVKKLEEAKLNFNIPTAADMPTLEIGNLDELQTALDGIGASVGAATGATSIDQFIETATEKFDRIEELTVKNTEKLTIVERQVPEMEITLNQIEIQLNDVYTTNNRLVDATIDKSYVDTRINEVVGTLKAEEIAPLRANIGRIDVNITNISNKLNNQLDIIYANVNRLDIA